MSLKADFVKSYGSFTLRLNVEAGDETLALLGASGCGKSLSLRCIAGIEKPDEGHIELNGRVLFDSEKKINLSPQERRTWLLFQNYALFPNMTVLQNIRTGARREKNRDRREENVKRMMETFGLTELAGHLPGQLSGGQQQRTALARILVSEPEIILLDEPFSALDSHLRFRLEEELRKVIKRFGGTVILVSHNRDEVFRLSDKIAVMNTGRIETVGGRHQVFSDPVTVNGARLTGCKNISRAEIIGKNRIYASDWGIELDVPESDRDYKYVGIRMHDISMESEENKYPFTIEDELENPFSVALMLRREGKKDGKQIGFELSKEKRKTIEGSRVMLGLPKEKLLLLKE